MWKMMAGAVLNVVRLSAFMVGQQVHAGTWVVAGRDVTIHDGGESL